MSFSSKLFNVSNETSLPSTKINECIVFAAPGDGVWDSRAIGEQVDALTKQGCHTSQIGDGERPISTADLLCLTKEVAKGNTSKLLVINAHGRMHNDDAEGEHLIQVGKNQWISTLFLLNMLKKELGSTPIEVVSEACYAGLNCREAAETLPRGSHFLALSTFNPILELEKTSLRDNLRGMPVKIDDFSADNILKVYLSKVFGSSYYFQNPIPSICSHNDSTPLAASLLFLDGRKFTLREKNLIEKELSPFIDKHVLHNVMKALENGTPMPNETRLMGAALAIAHVMNKDNPELMFEFLDRPIVEKQPSPGIWEVPDGLEAGVNNVLKKLFKKREHDLDYFIERSKIKPGKINLLKTYEDAVAETLLLPIPLPRLENLSSNLNNDAHSKLSALERFASIDPLKEKHDFFNSKLFREDCSPLGGFTPFEEKKLELPSLFTPSFTLAEPVSLSSSLKPPTRNDWFGSQAFEQQIPGLTFGNKQKPLTRVAGFAKEKLFGSTTDHSFFSTTKFQNTAALIGLGGYKPSALTNK